MGRECIALGFDRFKDRSVKQLRDVLYAQKKKTFLERYDKMMATGSGRDHIMNGRLWVFLIFFSYKPLQKIPFIPIPVGVSIDTIESRKFSGRRASNFGFRRRKKVFWEKINCRLDWWKRNYDLRRFLISRFKIWILFTSDAASFLAGAMHGIPPMRKNSSHIYHYSYFPFIFSFFPYKKQDFMIFPPSLQNTENITTEFTSPYTIYFFYFVSI